MKIEKSLISPIAGGFSLFYIATKGTGLCLIFSSIFGAFTLLLLVVLCGGQ